MTRTESRIDHSARQATEDRPLASTVAQPRLITLVLLSALAVLPVNMILPSLPKISAAFQADFALVNLSVAGFSIVTAFLEAIGGAISDRFGRRPVVLTALAIFIIASMGCVLAPTIGIFLPSFLFVLIAAPLLARHRTNPNVQGFVKGAYAAAIGTILGACILLGRIAIGDWLTALVGAVSLAILFRWKVSNPLLIAATAAVGLIAYPILQPGWVMVH